MNNIVAVHLISESHDHYNMLIDFSDKEDFVIKVQDICYEIVTGNIYDFFVSDLNGERNDLVEILVDLNDKNGEIYND